MIKYLPYIIILFSSIVNGQHPSHFVLGEPELENAEIYSILQTKSQELYVATNEGLFKYSHGKMHAINSAPNQRGIALFELTLNDKNEVYGFNLNGQILKIENNRLNVYLEIPKQYLNTRITIVINKDDNLVVASKGIFVIENNEVKELFFNPNYPSNYVAKTIDGKVILNTGDSKTYFLDGNRLAPISTLKESVSKVTSSQYPQYLKINNRYVSYEELTKRLEVGSSNGYMRDRFDYCQIAENEIWRNNIAGGVQVIKIENGLPVLKEIYFKNTYISKIEKGENGAIFLGTFGQGLIVIPNLNTLSHSLNDFGRSIRGISSDEAGNIFLADRANGIIHFKDTPSIIDSSLTMPYRIFNSSFTYGNTSNEFPNLFYNKNRISGAIKDIYAINQNELLAASSSGLWKLGTMDEVDAEFWSLFPSKNRVFHYRKIKERCLSVVFSETDSSIYLSTISRLIKIKKNNEIVELKFKNNFVIANDLLIRNNEIWCATQNAGILIFKNNKFVTQFNILNGLGSNTINKFVLKENKLFVSHKKGFQQFDIENRQWQNYGVSEGVIGGAIIDFTVTKNKIWYITGKELYSVPVLKENKIPSYNFKIDSIKLSNVIVDSKAQGKFKYDQNNLMIYPNYQGISTENEAVINFQLIGYDDDWQTTDPFKNKIEYKNLPPGDYTFNIKSEFRGASSETFKYAFQITPAFWTTWWFILGGIGLIMFSIVTVFNRREKLLRRRNAERLEHQALKASLVETELKALRSQMNPHFIFNCLNSIQDLILQGDTDSSYDYIVLFSDLVRNALNYSNHNLILLSNEITFLDTYLKLEQLRFDENFEYSIDAENIENINIPSLIIQPFVENAIVHGLFHKSGKKILRISFETSGQNLICIIEDNGIGREQAKLIQKRQGQNHESFALKSMDKRFQMLQKQYGKKISFTIKDANPSENFTGTIVEISIPVLY